MRVRNSYDTFVDPAPKRDGEISVTWAVAIPVLLLFIPLAAPMLMHRVFAHTDLGAFHLPLRRMLAAALRDGDSFAWTSQMFNGFYVHAEGQLGAFHPLHLLLYRFVPLTAAFNIELIVSYVFAFAGMWLFLRRSGFGTLAVGSGAIAFAFSGFQVLHLGHPNAVAIAAHIPWLLAALDAALSATARTRAMGVAGIALLTGSQILLGYPQYVYLSALACAIYVVVKRPNWPAFWLLAVAGLAGFAIGAVQLFPTADLLAHSNRASTTEEFRLSFSLHPLNLVQLLSPYVLPSRVHAAPEEMYVHELGVYNGALCTLAVAWALLRRRKLPFQPIARFAGGICAIGTILALGKYGYVYTGMAMLPLLGAFRVPARHLVLVHLGLALLAAVMVEDLVRSARDRTALQSIGWRIATPLALSTVAAAVALAWWLIGHVSTPPLYPGSVVIGTALMGVATLLVRDAARGVSAALLVIPIFLALDLGFWGYSYAWGSPPMSIDQIAALAPEPPGGSPPRSVHDADGNPTINYWLLRDARVARPYVGLAPQFSTPLTGKALQVAGVEWVRTGTQWRQVENPMPRLRVVPFTRISHTPATDLESTDIEETALVDRRIDPSLAHAADVSVRLVADRPGRLEIDVDASRHVLLAITESYHPGWRAEAGGGTEAVTLPLYGDYLGVLAPAGRYRLTLRFDPQSLRYGRYLSGAGLLAIALLFMIVRRHLARETQ